MRRLNVPNGRRLGHVNVVCVHKYVITCVVGKREKGVDCEPGASKGRGSQLCIKSRHSK
jgi:hypothetical protein